MSLITNEEYCVAIDRHKMLTATDEELRFLIQNRRGLPGHSDEVVVISCHMVLEQRYQATQR